jgi:hypothetical protein
MGVFDRLQALPPVGTRESPQLDFKAVVNRHAGKIDYFELAKDIAAMASAYGGAILIGAIEDASTGCLVKFKGMSESAAKEVVAAYEQAARDHCLPQPLVDHDALPHVDGLVVAIYVHAVLDRVVGVKVTPIEAHRFGSPSLAYVFPVRLSTHAIAFTPEKLPMLMNPQIRRIAILLESIPVADRNEVRLHWEPYRRGNNETPALVLSRCRLEAIGDGGAVVDIDANAVRMELVEPNNPRGHFQFPLDDVQSVWRDIHGQWCVRVAGHLELSGAPLYHTRRER